MSDVLEICSSDAIEQICNQLLAIFIDINNYYPNTNYIKIALTHVLTRFGLLLFINTGNSRTSHSNITVDDIKIILNYFDQE